MPVSYTLHSEVYIHIEAVYLPKLYIHPFFLKGVKAGQFSILQLVEALG